MLKGFHKLSPEEIDLLKIAPVMVCLLVAGADSKFDKRELHRAVRLANSKLKGGTGIGAFYQEIAGQFETNLKGYLALMPADTETRNKVIVAKIEKLNSILPLLDHDFALEYYNSLKDFALTVAEAAGGVFGLGAINKEEARFIQLPMIIDPATFHQNKE